VPSALSAVSRAFSPFSLTDAITPAIEHEIAARSARASTGKP
jgi:hypothetical protein